MNNINVFSREKFEEYKKINSNLNEITREKIERTQDRGFCFWCEKEKAEYPKQKPQLCVKCFVSVITNILEEIQKFGSVGINTSINQIQKDKNKVKAKQILEIINTHKKEFAEKYEIFILQLLNQEKKWDDFFKEK